MFDALNNPRVEFTCHDVVTSGVYSSYHVNMTSKKQVACVVDYISRETASGCRTTGNGVAQNPASRRMGKACRVTRDTFKIIPFFIYTIYLFMGIHILLYYILIILSSENYLTQVTRGS